MENSTMERLYIGGFEPPRLTVDHVLNRLRQHPDLASIKVQENHVDKASKFVHVNVVNTDNEKPSSPTAFDVIRKLFHNVVWMGCKLKVERARPHLLERLADERKQRSASVAICIESDNGFPQARNVPSQQKCNESNPPHFLRRYMRVRPRFQQEAHVVDTRPIAVTNWEEFNRLLRKRKAMTKPTSNHHSKDEHALVATKAQPTRALHLRFVTAGKFGVTAKSHVSNDKGDGVSLSPGPSESSTSDAGSMEGASSDESEGCDMGRGTTAINDGAVGTVAARQSSYVWSDDEDEVEGSTTYEAGDSPESRPLGEQRKHPQSKSSSSSFDSSDEDESDAKVPVPSRPKTAVYNSSPDEESDTPESVKVDDEALLQNDVESNLQILAQIFPSIATKPIKVKGDNLQGVNVDVMAEGISRRAGDAGSGWGPTGQILRYDPQKKDSRSLVVNAESTSVSKVDAPVVPVAKDALGKLPGVPPPKNDAEGTEGDPTNGRGHLYHQDKLEAVFREARSEFSATIPVATAPSNNGASFAFSFPLGESTDAVAKAETPTASTTFAFSFNVADASEPVRTDRGADVDDDLITNGEEGDAFVRSVKRRRLDAPFSDEEIDSYIQLFLTGNGGDRILADVEGWRNDETLKAQWLKERTALTADWKRKHKAAKARKNSYIRKS